MKLRNHICLVALLGTLFTVLSAGSNALGQGLQPPFMAPTPPSLNYGVFYFSAGAKYRNVQTFTMNVSGVSNPIITNSGTIPFGPTSSGNFGVGTGITGFTGGTGNTWAYDNGQISGDVLPPDPFIEPAPAIPVACQDTTVTPPVTVICNSDSDWTYSILQPVIGRFIVEISGTGICCDGKAVPSSSGSFVIDDPTTQVNNLSSMASTTQATFQLVVPGSAAFVLSTTPDADRIFQGAVVGPSMEFGYQLSNYFDLFYGFSWFTTSNSMLLSQVIQGQAGHVLIQDTYPFISDDTAAWPLSLGAFQSSQSINTASSAAQNYHLATNSPLRGVYPNRQFSVQTDASVTPADIQETVSNSAEFTPLENRLGARSWAPLWGLGRIGATVGAAIIPTRFKITGSSSYVVVGGGGGTVTAGTVLSAQTLSQDNWRTLYGGFVGGDLLLGNTGYFLYGSADYMWVNNLSYTLGSVTTIFNPGGFTAGLSAGIQF